MQQDKVLSLLGLMQRAGKLKSGGFATEQSIKKGKARLVLVTADTSEASVKHYRDMCAYRKLPLVQYGDKETLGYALGKEFRSVVAIEDEGFATKLQALLAAQAGNGR